MRSELMPCLAEARALGKCEDPGGRDRKDRDRRAIFAVEGAITNLVFPSPVPLGGPHRGQAFEQGFICDLSNVTFNHDVDPCIPVEAASCQNHMRISPKIAGLLFGVSRAKMKSPIEPDGDEGSDVGATISSDRDNPKQLGGFQELTRFLPWSGLGIRLTESRIEGRNGFAHLNSPFE
jgi:hypothetical protein